MDEFSCPVGEVCRPTFWNVPEWLHGTLYVMGAVAALVFLLGLAQHFLFWRGGKAPYRVTDLRRRFRNWLTFGVLTKKVILENQPAGAAHAGLMTGMVILFVGTALATIDWDVTRLFFDWRLLQGGFYYLYKLVLDLFGLAALAALGVALYTRYVTRPRRLWGYGEARWHFDDDLWLLLSFTVLVLTGFALESLRLAATRPWYQLFSPIGYSLSFVWSGLGPEALHSVHSGVWLFHAGLTLFWIAYFPFTKWAHIFTSSLNTFFKPLTPPNAIAPIPNLEEQETFGVSRFEHFTWKQVMDFDACTRCGRCQAVCPASLTEKALSPKMIEVKLWDYGMQSLNGGNGKPIHGEVISAQELWDCTTCMACVNACPVGIDPLSTILDLRRHLTLTEGMPQPPSNRAMDSMERQGNPFGLPLAGRWDAFQDLDLPFAELGETYEILYWVGCAGAYDQRSQKVTRALVEILRAAGVRFAVMREERCTCESARRLGNEYLFQMATAENIENLKQYRFDRLLAQCPHCFNTFKNEYVQFGAQLSVVHHTELIAELLSARRLTLRRRTAGALAFHDSCYLGRYNGVLDAPRKVLSAVAGAGTVELQRSREQGLCCGGGGGRMWLEESSGTRINRLRMQEVLEAKPSGLAVACPFCLTMLDDAAKELGVEGQVARRDLAEWVVQGLKSEQVE